MTYYDYENYGIKDCEWYGTGTCKLYIPQGNGWCPKRRKMNKIYFAYVDEDMGGTFISAPSLKEAKKLALKDEYIGLYIDNYIDLKCHCVRDENGKIRKTSLPTKILTIQEILQERCHWWSCYNCEQDEYFEYAYRGVDGTDYYKCPKCGGIYYIPYAGL